MIDKLRVAAVSIACSEGTTVRLHLSGFIDRLDCRRLEFQA